LRIVDTGLSSRVQKRVDAELADNDRLQAACKLRKRFDPG
jgi:hypothetical protein